MNKNKTQDRSPHAPALELADAVSFLKKLHGQIGRSSVTPEVAARAMGYAGLTGSSLTLLATLTQYDLISREKGSVSITPLSLRILHPVSTDQQAAAMRTAALSPKVFSSLFNDYNECTEDVLMSHLVQSGFNPSRAKRVARVYTANKAFAKLEANDILAGTNEPNAEEPEKVSTKITSQPATVESSASSASRIIPDMLAQYTIPLGANQATLVFTGQQLNVDDFDALIDFVQFSKRQFERAAKRSPRIVEAEGHAGPRNDIETLEPGDEG